jgi:hypothetical protein
MLELEQMHRQLVISGLCCLMIASKLDENCITCVKPPDLQSFLLKVGVSCAVPESTSQWDELNIYATLEDIHHCEIDILLTLKMNI